MELNADFSQRVVVHAARLDWMQSPAAGVDRRMLDRIGEEVARATSIVRYAPASRFPLHTHGGGEEFFVLEGVFEDESGEYPAGYYVRNPPTSAHTPGSAQGCVIFVKLWQFDLDDRTHVRIDTRKMLSLADPDRRGVHITPLFHDGREDVRLERWAPGAQVPIAAPGGVELLVLEGGFEDERRERYEPLSWLRAPAGGAVQAVAGIDGCEVWLKAGHLLVERTPRAL